jgi:hypothetical protein
VVGLSQRRSGEVMIEGERGGVQNPSRRWGFELASCGNPMPRTKIHKESEKGEAVNPLKE